MSLAALRELPLLSAISDAELDRLDGHTRWLWHQPGETVVRQGQEGVDFYILVRGQVEVLLEGESPTRLALLGPGEFFGELTLMGGGPAPATVVAREVTSLLQIDAGGMALLVEQNGRLAAQIIAELARREREAWTRLQRVKLRERTLADHIARQSERTHPEWVGTGAWSQRVRAAIARGCRTGEPVVFVGEPGSGKELAAARTHYNGARKEGPFITFDCASWSASGWLEAVRMASHGSLLLKHADEAPAEAAGYVADQLPTRAGEGRGRLPGRVPRIMATASDVAERDPSALEEVLLREGFAVFIPPLRERREDLAALVRYFIRKYGHRTGGGPDYQPVSAEALRRLASHPFQTGNVRELERVIQEAVLLAGGGPIGAEHLRLDRVGPAAERPRIGLALGGGAVRGAAHIGVIRALHEEAIPIDCIAGTSAGALVGSLYAGGLEWQELQEAAVGLGWLSVAEPAWPRGGFLTNRRMRRFLDQQMGPVTFDDLRLPFVAVAADANTGAEVVLREGRVADAVRASTAIPGIIKPVELDGRLLVDGGVVTNVPAGVARSLGADVVIAVDVTAYGFSQGAPRSSAEAMMRAIDIMSRQTVMASLEWADVVIRPQLSGLHSYSAKGTAEFLRRGYAAAREAMPAIKARIEEVGRDMRR